MFRELLNYISNHMDGPISLDSLSRISGYSPYYMHRKFREETGEALGSYLQRQRAEKAAYLLVFTRLPVTEIKYHVGYSTDSSFSKAFKKVMNVSPRAYRVSNQYMVSLKDVPEQEFVSFHYEKVTLPDQEAIIFPSVGNYFSREIYVVWGDVARYLKENDFLESDFSYYGVLHVCQNVVSGCSNRYDAVIVPKRAMNLNISKHFRSRLPGGRFVLYRFSCRVDQLQRISLSIGKHLEEEGIRHGTGSSYFRFDRLPDPECPDNLFTEWYIPLEQ